MAREFGNRVKRARTAQGLSQMELADKLGVSQAAVSNWEQGKTEPRPAERAALEKITGPLRRNRSSNGSASNNSEPHELPQSASAFGAWLQRNRARADLSVPELAAKAEISSVAIYNIEAGKSVNPRMETKRKLAQALKTDLPDDVQQEAADSQSIEGLGPLTDFDPHDEDDRPSRPGVYVFYDVSERPVYVGKAASIAKRVADHADAFWFKYPIVANAAYIEIADDALRHQVEQVLIRFLKSNAVINKQSVIR